MRRRAPAPLSLLLLVPFALNLLPPPSPTLLLLLVCRSPPAHQAQAFAAARGGGRRRRSSRSRRVASGGSNRKSNSRYHSYLSSSSPDRRILTASSTNATILIDAENVRGKSGFELSHVQLVDRTAAWAAQRGLVGRVTLVVDHGSVPGGYYLSEVGLGIVFAGPDGQKADDVIVRDVSYVQETLGRDCLVVTADGELIRRCYGAASRGGRGGRRLELVPPGNFLEDLERVTHMLEYDGWEEGGGGTINTTCSNAVHVDLVSTDEVTIEGDESENESVDGDDRSEGEGLGPALTPMPNPNQLGLAAEEIEMEMEMEREVRLWGQVVDAEIQLKRGRGSHKKRQKLKRQLRSLREKLATLKRDGGSLSTLERVTAAASTTLTSSGWASTSTSTSASTSTTLPREVQNDLMSRWQRRRQYSARAERTGDRIVLAELLRRQVETIVARQGHASDGSGDDDDDESSHSHDERDDDALLLHPASAHVRYVNALAGRASPSPPTDGGAGSTAMAEAAGAAPAPALERRRRSPEPLRLVVVSDTHGYEASLTSEGAPRPWDVTLRQGEGEDGGATAPPDKTRSEMKSSGGNGNGNALPPGDVLLHLGDFAIDAPSMVKRREALSRFDAWLAEHPHPTKIVLRGNHDPFTVPFPASNAHYVSTPRTMDVGGWKLALVPYVTHRRYEVPAGDLLATHVPPRAVLDRCTSGALAGCSFLRSSVEGMAGRSKPRLWLCGHIHEGRGSRWARFGRPGGGTADAATDTLVINCSNANPGIACKLIHGPVIAELNDEDARSQGGGMSHVAGGAPVPNADLDWDLGRSYLDVTVPDGVGQLLLAVDLGLRMGAALFDEKGRLLRYEQFHFDRADDLYEHVPSLFATWEDEANDAVVGHDEEPIQRWSLTHVAIEGGDVTLLDAWRTAVETDDSTALPRGGRGARLHTVRPEEWRADLLTKKERASGRKAKEAARLIARQVVNDMGTAAGGHRGKFKTDVAEAVTLGFHMSRRLGWVETNVRRASNGMVLIPR